MFYCIIYIKYFIVSICSIILLSTTKFCIAPPSAVSTATVYRSGTFNSLKTLRKSHLANRRHDLSTFLSMWRLQFLGLGEHGLELLYGEGKRERGLLEPLC